MRDVMTGVVHSARGSAATTARIDGIKVAGKTGTAQKAVPGEGYVKGRYTVVFGCFLPVEAPELLFIVVFDEPKRADGGMVGGGSVAAPVYRAVMERWLKMGRFVPLAAR
jgi:cell division protein FtsI/penicillin-binding protein 2